MLWVSVLGEDDRWGVRGEGQRKPEGTTPQPDLLQLRENNSRFEKGFGEVDCRLGVGGTVTSPNKSFCLSLPWCLGLLVSLSPTTFKELNLRENTVWRRCFTEGQRTGCLIFT